MAPGNVLGELEYLVMLAVIQLDTTAGAVEIFRVTAGGRLEVARSARAIARLSEGLSLP